MNFTLRSLMVNSLSSSPVISKPLLFNTNSLKISNSRFSKQFNSVYFSSSVNQNTYFIRTEFSQILNSAIKLIDSKYNYNKKSFYEQTVISDPKPFTFVKCTFIQCVSNDKHGGGAILTSNFKSNIKTIDCVFTECATTKKLTNGGAIAILDSRSNVTIEKCCFSQCTAILAGHALFVKSFQSKIFINNSQIVDCPQNVLKTQTSVIEHNSMIELKSVNITNAVTPRVPALRSRIAESHSIYSYFTLFSIYVESESPIYDITVQHKQFEANFNKWNVINCTGNYRSIANYKVSTSIKLFDHVFKECAKQIFISTSSKAEKISFINFISDAPILADTEQDSFELINFIQTEIPEPIIEFADMPDVCQGLSKGLSIRIEFSPTLLLILFAILIIGLFAFVLIGRIAHYYIKRRNMQYTLLSVPEIIE